MISSHHLCFTQVKFNALENSPSDSDITNYGIVEFEIAIA